MRQRLLLLACFLILSKAVSAQMVGTSIFLPGHWLEIGQLNNGSFGAPAPPAGYHASGSTSLGEVYDYGHDGWGVGSPALFGDYTLPGSPFEGWELQVNGSRNQAFCPSTTYAAGTPLGTLTGANISYVNTGASLIANWAGTAGPAGALQITQETRVDTNSSWVKITTRFKNTSAAAIPGVYYLRSCDPDNDEVFSFNFATNNTITYQNDADHRVLVSSAGQSFSNAYLGLGTKDCRARAFIYTSWSLSGSQDLGALWSGAPTMAGTTQFAQGGTLNGDYAIGLVYNIGTINAGDSAVISYAYLFNGTIGIDSAFPDPVLAVNNTPVVTATDTFNACAFPTLTSLPVSVLNATTGDWTWSSWTWSPSTGLASTTGVTNTVDLNSIPSTITYTITGTDSTSGMYSCNNKVFYLTVTSCHSAVNNGPCIGDSLILNMKGDSTGATYVWYGPSPSTTVFSTLQSPFIYPSTFADSGEFHVIRTIAGVHDTDSTYVVIHPLPVINTSNNSPLCTGMVDTLLLSVTPGGAGETYSWTGPGGFTSTLEFPSIPGFTAANAGVYSVAATSSFGCKNSGTTTATIVPPPAAPPITGPVTYCFGTTFVPFTVAGTNIKWYATDTSTTYTTVAPTINTHLPGTYTFYATQTTGCESPKDSITVVVYPRIDPDFGFAYHRACTQDEVDFTNTSTVATSYSWSFGDGSPISTAVNPSHTYTAQGVYPVQLTGYYATCQNDTVISIDTRHTVTAGFSIAPDTFCLGTPAAFTNLSTTSLQGISGHGQIVAYAWSFGDGTSDTAATPSAHIYASAGIYTVTLTATDSLSCQNTTSNQLYVLLTGISALTDTTICLTQPFAINNIETLLPNIGLNTYTYSWSPSTYLSSDTAHVPYLIYPGTPPGTYMYTETSTLQPYGCVAYHDYTINVVLPSQLQNVTANATITYGNSIQLNADSEIHYMWTPNDGSLNNNNINDPIATPSVTTTYTVYGMDIYGCRDTATVTINVDSMASEYMPSGFTPNNDGLNDVFRPIGLKFQHLVDFRVYNRWGQQVFYTNNIEKGWDGTFNGTPQDMGVYYYTITVSRPGYAENTVYKGEVTLIR